MSKYTAAGLCAYAEKQLGRPYWNGTFGQVASKDLYEQKKYGQKLDYGPWEGDYEKAVGQKVHDCNGLFKGYLWCDGPDSGRYTYKNVTGDDLTVEEIYSNSTAKGSLDSIPNVRGVLVFTKSFGHMGIYVGNGYVIEARGHAYGVVKTKLHSRSWALWCKSKYIDYTGAEESNTPPKPTGNAQVMSYQSWINRYLPIQYLGTKLDVDGKFGPLTRKAAVKCLQYWLNRQYGAGLAVDGGYGPLTKAACKVLRKGSSGDGVYILQGLLYCHGYDPKGFDGSFGVHGGNGCLNAVKSFQRDKRLEIDGEAGPLTFEKLCKE